eukprot:7085499-Ditylum_brightwellii.AAC.1
MMYGESGLLIIESFSVLLPPIFPPKFDWIVSVVVTAFSPPPLTLHILVDGSPKGAKSSVVGAASDPPSSTLLMLVAGSPKGAKSSV